MAVVRRRVDVIKEIPRIRKLVTELQTKFPAVTPSDRIYAYYDPAYGVWHVTCCSWFIYESKKYKLWCKILRQKFKAIRFIFVMRYIVSSDREKLNTKEDNNFFFLE